MKLTRPEIYKIVNGYIGVSGGYLGDFSYRTHREFYPYYCDLDINPDEKSGTTRQRFLTILERSDGLTQAKILRGVLKKYPVDYFSEDVREKKKEMADEIAAMISRLETTSPVATPSLATTSEVVDRAIQDAETLIKVSGATSGVDRIHTALHGYLRAVCDKQGISVQEDASLTELFKRLRTDHSALKIGGSQQADVSRILRAISNVLDTLNPLRNKASVAHPNQNLLEEDEAMFVINSARTILHYLNSKFR
jgi:hypothetical protein